MDDLLDVISKISKNHRKISSVKELDEIRYFEYDDKYTFSIGKLLSGYVFTSYPDVAVEDAINPTTSIKEVVFMSNDLNLSGANQVFENLYTILATKLHGLDQIFKNILSDDPDV